MMFKRFTYVFIVCVASLFGSPTHAENAIANEQFSFRGFGTVGVSCYSAPYDFTREERPYGPGKSKQCDTQLDSTLGLQLDANLSSSLQGTLQAVSYYRADGTFTPEVTQTNLRWEINEEFVARVGRMQFPLLFVSDYRNVLYAQHWARPPVDLYNQVPAYSFDGVDVTERNSVGDWITNLRVGIGKSDFQTSYRNGANPYMANTKYGYVDMRINKNNWLFMASVLGGKIRWNQPAVDAVLSSLSSQLADQLSMLDKRLTIVALGAKYETDLTLVQAEYLFSSTDSFYRDQHAAYITVGQHVGEWMPYTTLSRRWSMTKGKENLTTDATEFSTAKYLVDSTNADRSTIALGVSHRLGEQAIIKTQMDWIKPDAASNKPSTIEHLFTLNLDFIF